MAHADIYSNFKHLASHNREGVDYQVVVEARRSDLAIIAPHGGGIEPGTSEIATAIAGEDFSLYRFEGWRSRGNEDLHITGINSDEPRCIELAAQSKFLVAIHGCRGGQHSVYVGGLDNDLGRNVIKVLTSAAFTAISDDTHHSGRDPANICNRSGSRKGVQLEITEGLRRAMFRGWRRRERENVTELFDRFVATLRGLLLEMASGHSEN